MKISTGTFIVGLSIQIIICLIFFLFRISNGMPYAEAGIKGLIALLIGIILNFFIWMYVRNYD